MEHTYWKVFQDVDRLLKKRFKSNKRFFHLTPLIQKGATLAQNCCKQLPLFSFLKPHYKGLSICIPKSNPYSFSCNITVSLSTAVKYDNPACCKWSKDLYLFIWEFKTRTKIIFKNRISWFILRYLLHLVTWWLLYPLFASLNLTESSWLCRLPDRYLEWMHTVFFLSLLPRNTRSYLHSLSLDGYSPAEICYIAICLLSTNILQNASVKESIFFK